MTALPLLLCLLLVATCIGRRLLQLAGVQLDARLDRMVYAAGLGLGVVAYAVFALGMLGLLRLAPVLVTMGVLTAGSWSGIRATLLDLRPPYRRPGKLTLVAGAVLVVFGAVAVLACHVPPGAHEWDVLSYHLAVPKLYLLHGRIVFLPTQHQSNFPFLVQMLFLLGLMLQGSSLAALTHFATAAITVAALIAIGRRHFEPAAGTVAAVAFAATPIVLWESSVAYIDVAQTMYVVLALGAALDYRARRETRLLALAGAFMGLALAVKTLSLIPFAIFALLLLIERVPVKPLLAYLACAVVVGCPFFVKTYVLTGNPVYPFAYSVFGGRYWDQVKADTYAGEQRGFGINHMLIGPREDLQLADPPWKKPTPYERLRDLILNPLKLVSVPRIYYNWHDISFYSHLGFLFLALPPLLALSRRASSAAKWTAALCALWFVGWSLSMQYTRYLIPLLGPLMLVAGEAAVRAAGASRTLRAAVVSAVALQVALTAWIFLPAVPEHLAVATSAEARDEYLTHSIDCYTTMQWINANTPSDAGVILFEEARGYYLDRPYLWGNIGHSRYIPYERFANGRAMVDWFLAHGYKFALVNLRFKNPQMTEQDRNDLRDASSPEALLALMLRWYNPNTRDNEAQRWLLGDALRDGSAMIRTDGSSREVIVIEFRPRP